MSSYCTNHTVSFILQATVGVTLKQTPSLHQQSRLARTATAMMGTREMTAALKLAVVINALKTEYVYVESALVILAGSEMNARRVFVNQKTATTTGRAIL